MWKRRILLLSACLGIAAQPAHEFGNGQDQIIAKITKLGASVLQVDKSVPGHPLVRVDFVGAKVDAATLALVRRIPTLTYLSLDGSTVTDADLARLTNTRIQLLSLGQTKVTNKGLKHVRKMKALRYLYLNNTGVSDDGLRHLKMMKALEFVNLRFSEVTRKGVLNLRKAVPKLKIGWGD